MNRLLRALLKTGIYLLNKSEDARDRVQDGIEDFGERAKQVIGQEGHAVRNAITFTAGLAVGMGVAILFAPASGEETRRSITEKVQNMGDAVRERLSAEVRKPATGTEG